MSFQHSHESSAAIDETPAEDLPPVPEEVPVQEPPPKPAPTRAADRA